MRDKQAQRARIRIQREMPMRTYAHLWTSSEFMLECGRRDQNGASHHYLSSIILTAFALEAYLNHAGREILNSWEQVEKSLSPLDKFSLICDIANIDKLDPGKTPLSTIREIFKFRNMVAHGKTHPIKEEKEIESSGLHYDMYGGFLKAD